MASKPRTKRPRPDSAPRQRAPISQDPAFIALELGSEWPSFMSQVVGEGPRKVLCQQEGEDCLAFAERVAASVAESASLPAALLLCNQRGDGRQMLARRRLLTSVLERRPARVCLATSDETRTELCDALTELASELPETEVRFGAPKESAGKASKLRSVA